MITALDHVVLVCPDLTEGVMAYATLLGHGPVWQSEGEGQSSAVFALGNTSLEIIAPTGSGPVADKLRDMTADGAVLSSLAYRSDALDEDHRLCTRRGLTPSAIGEYSSQHASTGADRHWRAFRIPDSKMASVKTFILQSYTSFEAPNLSVDSGAVSHLDHLVINTPNPDRTVATYGARLDLRLALDRTAEQWKTRFLFFRLGGLTLEIIHRLDTEHDPNGPDVIWGITWETQDLDAAHARLTNAGITVSELRTGRKPGSRVFTVKSGTLGIPTMFIAHAKE